jgi:hypothetical protein
MNMRGRKSSPIAEVAFYVVIPHRLLSSSACLRGFGGLIASLKGSAGLLRMAGVRAIVIFFIIRILGKHFDLQIRLDVQMQ